ncbi:hypothetical protein [Photobacterium leiognathi]|uniref:hypothetical protein n=1 Tax=Photobacterium leiognathi TaxID=553611 RepID=UPI002982AD33|nr:hypothetical protein [Photobacterium leiognathi]
MKNILMFWLYVNRLNLLVFGVFFLLVILYFPFSTFDGTSDKTNGVVVGKGYKSTVLGNVPYILVKLFDSEKIIRLSKVQHTQLSKGELICIKRLSRVFAERPKYMFYKTGNCT